MAIPGTKAGKDLKCKLALAAACAVFPWAGSARADDFCADRPGQTTPPCAIAPGKIMIETAAVDWSRQRDATGRTDTVTYGATELRIGLMTGLEAELGWEPFGTQRIRDAATGQVSRASGSGDLSLGFLYGISGVGGPVAVQGFVTLPTGGAVLGAGDWGGGVRLPVAFDIGKGVEFSLTPEIDAAVNGSGHGRHLAYGGAAGLGFVPVERWTLSADYSVFRDQDPAGSVTRQVAGLSLAWQARPNLQLDLGGEAGIDHDSPGLRVYFGLARSF